jgi:hypothetical protein
VRDGNDPDTMLTMYSTSCIVYSYEGRKREREREVSNRRRSPHAQESTPTNAKLHAILNTIEHNQKEKSTQHIMPPTPLRESDILFPSASTSIKTTLLDLKRSNLSIHNRLTSISADGAFVAKVASTFQLPLIANERCGSWYIDPALKAGGAYFKSTDGHFGEWSFSLRRLNLGVLEVVGARGG